MLYEDNAREWNADFDVCHGCYRTFKTGELITLKCGDRLCSRCYDYDYGTANRED